MKCKLHLFLTIALLLSTTLLSYSCSDDDDVVNIANLVGTWDKDYGKGVASDGYRRIVFKNDSTGYNEVYNAIAINEEDATIITDFTYTVRNEPDCYEVTLNFDDGRTSSYRIMRLSARHMSWSLAIYNDANNVEDFYKAED